MNLYYHTKAMYNYMDVFGRETLFTDEAQKIVDKLDAKSKLLKEKDPHVMAILSHHNYGYLLVFPSDEEKELFYWKVLEVTGRLYPENYVDSDARNYIDYI